MKIYVYKMLEKHFFDVEPAINYKQFKMDRKYELVKKLAEV